VGWLKVLALSSNPSKTKQNKTKKTRLTGWGLGGMAQVVEFLPSKHSKHNALNSNPNTAKTTKKQNRLGKGEVKARSVEFFVIIQARYDGDLQQRWQEVVRFGIYFGLLDGLDVQ
jgi:hypothetical protein